MKTIVTILNILLQPTEQTSLSAPKPGLTIQSAGALWGARDGECGAVLGVSAAVSGWQFSLSGQFEQQADETLSAFGEQSGSEVGAGHPLGHFGTGGVGHDLACKCR